MQQRRVLIIDDEEPIRRLMAHVFQSAGYAVDTAGSSREALERLCPATDLVTVDLMLPDGSGWGVIEQVASRPKAPAVVVVSGRSDADRHRLRHCVAGVVNKPFMPSELLDICDAALRSHDRAPKSRPQERRRAPRRDLVMDVRVASAVGNPLLRGKVVTLSQLGAELELPASVDRGQTLRVAMRFPGRGRPLLVDGRIQRCDVRGGIWACGLEFANPSPDLQRELSLVLELPSSVSV